MPFNIQKRLEVDQSVKLNDIATYLLDNEQFHDYEFVYSENPNQDITLRLDIDTKTKQIRVTTHADFVF